MLNDSFTTFTVLNDSFSTFNHANDSFSTFNGPNAALATHPRRGQATHIPAARQRASARCANDL